MTSRRSGYMAHLSLFLGRLGGFAAYCLRGNCRILRASGLREVRCSGLGEADARLITIGELDARSLECAADRWLIGRG